MDLSPYNHYTISKKQSHQKTVNTVDSRKIDRKTYNNIFSVCKNARKTIHSVSILSAGHS